MGISKHLLQEMSAHKDKVKGPHFLFSAENPRFPQKTALSHEDVVKHLKGAGYDAHEVHGHYGSPERSIAVYGVSKMQAEELHDMAARLGQDSSIYSNGKQHEMRFHHGENAGKAHYGEGTKWHLQKPGDFFTTLPGGQHHFTHSFNFEQLHPAGQLHQASELLGKTVSPEQKTAQEAVASSLTQKLEGDHDAHMKGIKDGLKDDIKKNEQERMRLVHFSHAGDLKQIDPKYKQTGVDARTKGRDTEHPHSFYYVEGTEPEQVVVSQSRHKYKTSINPAEHPIYDLGHDPRGVVHEAIKENQGALNMDMVHAKLKAAGFHGFRNSKHPSLSNVVAMYHPLAVEHHEQIR